MPWNNQVILIVSTGEIFQQSLNITKNSGQSYRHFTLVNVNCSGRVVFTSKLLIFTTLRVAIDAHIGFIRLAPES